jgi:hypothetical protein
MMQMAWDAEQYANGDLYVRGIWGGTWGSWFKMLHSGNYPSYALPLSGGTVSGETTFSADVTSVKALTAANVYVNIPNNQTQVYNDSAGHYNPDLMVTKEIALLQRGTNSNGTLVAGDSCGKLSFNVDTDHGSSSYNYNRAFIECVGVGTSAWRTPVMLTFNVGSFNDYPYEDERFRINGNDGKLYSTYNYVTAYSDVRLKENINDLTDGLDIVTQLQPRTFQYTGNTPLTRGVSPIDDSEERYQPIQYGFIADEVLEIAPQYIDIADGEIDGQQVNDLKSMSTTQLIPMIINAIKELNAKIERLEGSN